MARIEDYSAALLQDLSAFNPTPANLRLKDRHRKRFLSSGSDLDNVAIAGFLADNAAVVSNITTSPGVVADARDFIANALMLFTSQHTNARQSVVDLPTLYQLFKFGPGASYGTKATHFCDKIDEDLVCTERALPFIRMMRFVNPHLKLDDIKNLASCRKVRLVRGSKLACVPKNQETSRTISKQPLWNMALQLAIGRYIEGALRRVGIDIGDQQDKNKILAQRGSINGKLATIDLKSASNLFSFALIEALWPTEFVELFKISRSEEVQIGDTWHTVNMVSMMGNGFTFPMMTMTLLALVYATNTTTTKRFHLDYSEIGVYGDDIIIPACDYSHLVRELTASGLIVNESKSYATGPFRESCGGDYWEGKEITPFYVEALETDQQVYIAINKCLDWSARHTVVLCDTVSYLLTLLSDVNVVPEWENPDSGIRLGLPLPTTYYIYSPIKRTRPLRSSSAHNEMLCILGGYVSVEGRKRVSVYSIRSSTLRYERKKCNRPKGFITGRAPLVYNARESTFRDSLFESLKM